MASQDNFGSMPKVFSYHGDDEEPLSSCDVKPRILLMGLRRSGKSSIQKVNIILINMIGNLKQIFARIEVR